MGLLAGLWVDWFDLLEDQPRLSDMIVVLNSHFLLCPICFLVVVNVYGDCVVGLEA